MFKDHLERNDGGFYHKVAKVPENAVGEERPLLGCPETITNETCNDEDGEKSSGRIEDSFGKREIIIQIETGGMRIEEKGDVVKHDPELGEEPFGESEVPNLVAFDDDIEVAFSPENKHQNPYKKDSSNQMGEYFLPFGT
jgi:hypothetical protein